MKKTVIVLLVLTIVLASLSGCAVFHRPTEIEGVTMTVTDVTATGATVTVTDENPVPHTYGQWFVVQKETAFGWKDVKPIIRNYGFTDMAMGPGKVSGPLDWAWLYGELEPGTYRLVKEIDDDYFAAVFSVPDKSADTASTVESLGTRLEDVTLTVTPENITESTAEINISVTNNSDRKLHCGAFAYLDVLTDGEWVEYPLIENVQWHMLAYECEPGSTCDVPYPIQWLYGDLPAGHYRISKEFNLPDSSEKVGYASVEFEVTP